MAGVVVTMESDVARLIRDQQRTIQKQDELVTKLRTTVREGGQTRRAFERAGRAGTTAFGPRLEGAITTAATQMIGLQSAVRLVGQAMQFVQEETDRATEGFAELEGARRGLRQIATGPLDLARIEERADVLAARFAVDRQIVRELLFSARSEGFQPAVEQILAAAPVIAPRAQATAAGQVPGLFPGADLSATQAINAAFVAAQQSRANFEQIVAALPGAAAGAAFAGATPAETFALQSVLPSRFKSPEQAADRIRALGVRLALEPEFAGRGIVANVQALVEAGAERQKEILGTSSELNTAFTVISEEMATIQERQRQIEEAISQAGTPAAAISRAREAALDPRTETGRRTRAFLAREQARIQREVTTERDLADVGFARQAALDRAITDLRRAEVDGRNINEFAIFMGETFGRVSQLFGEPPERVRRAAISGADVFSFEDAGAVGRAVNSLAGAAERLNRTVDRLENRRRSLAQPARAQASQPQE